MRVVAFDDMRSMACLRLVAFDYICWLLLLLAIRGGWFLFIGSFCGLRVVAFDDIYWLLLLRAISDT